MKKVLSVILIILLILSISNFSQAASEASLKITAGKSTLSPGDSVTLVISVGQTNIPTGLNAIEGVIDYDTNVFEKLTTNSFLKVLHL